MTIWVKPQLHELVKDDWQFLHLGSPITAALGTDRSGRTGSWIDQRLLPTYGAQAGKDQTITEFEEGWWRRPAMPTDNEYWEIVTLPLPLEYDPSGWQFGYTNNDNYSDRIFFEGWWWGLTKLRYDDHIFQPDINHKRWRRPRETPTATSITETPATPPKPDKDSIANQSKFFFSRWSSGVR